MNRTRVAFAAALSAALLLHGARAGAQTLASRIEALVGRDGAVVLHFAARDGVCGDGRSYFRIGPAYYQGSWSEDRAACTAGPVQVRLTLQGGAVARVESWVGPLSDRGGRGLGVVPAAEAARYLLGLAAGGNSPAAAGAIGAAALADSAVIWPALLPLARDARYVRAVRQDAMFWLSRFASAALGGDAEAIMRLDAGGRGESDEKTHAVFVLSQLPRAESVPLLIDIAQTSRDAAVQRSAMFWLAQSGDARAVGVFEGVLRGGGVEVYCGRRVSARRAAFMGDRDYVGCRAPHPAGFTGYHGTAWSVLPLRRLISRACSRTSLSVSAPSAVSRNAVDNT